MTMKSASDSNQNHGISELRGTRDYPVYTLYFLDVADPEGWNLSKIAQPPSARLSRAFSITWYQLTSVSFAELFQKDNVSKICEWNSPE